MESNRVKTKPLTIRMNGADNVVVANEVAIEADELMNLLATS